MAERSNIVPSDGGRDPSASGRVVRALIQGLHDGDFVPGQRLAEPDLMERFAVSRPTAREAIRRLEAEGVVEVHRFRGAQIRLLSPREALDALQIVELLIGLAARQAAERIGEGANREQVREGWSQVAAHEFSSDGYELLKARNRFYRIVTAASDNRELKRILPSLNVHLIRHRYRMDQQERFADYRAIVERIEAGDPAGAEEAARLHLRKTALLITTGPSED